MEVTSRGFPGIDLRGFFTAEIASRELCWIVSLLVSLRSKDRTRQRPGSHDPGCSRYCGFDANALLSSSVSAYGCSCASCFPTKLRAFILLRGTNQAPKLSLMTTNSKHRGKRNAGLGVRKPDAANLDRRSTLRFTQRGL